MELAEKLAELRLTSPEEAYEYERKWREGPEASTRQLIRKFEGLAITSFERIQRSLRAEPAPPWMRDVSRAAPGPAVVTVNNHPETCPHCGKSLKAE